MGSSPEQQEVTADVNMEKTTPDSKGATKEEKKEKKRMKRERNEEKEARKQKKLKLKEIDSEEKGDANDPVSSEESSGKVDDAAEEDASTSTPTASADADKPALPDDNSNTTTNVDMKALEVGYQVALRAYKADKTNKDLRRAKTAAKKAWDAGLLATADPGAEALTCRNCSQLFLFCDQEEFTERKWEKPSQCKDCTFRISTVRSQETQKSRRDQKQNMCYAFQKTGACSRGDRCKFSHMKDHVGKTKPVRVLPLCKYFEKGETCPHKGVDGCRFRHEEVEAEAKSE